jgi:hypothetical protein
MAGEGTYGYAIYMRKASRGLLRRKRALVAKAWHRARKCALPLLGWNRQVAVGLYAAYGDILGHSNATARGMSSHAIQDGPHFSTMS